MTVKILDTAVHVALDIETLGVTVGAPVLSIGFAFIDPGKGVVHTSHFSHDFEDAVKAATHVSASTIKWWFKSIGEDPKLAEQFARGDSVGTKLFLRCIDKQITQAYTLAEGLGYVDPEDNAPLVRVWAAPARFDFTLLQALYLSQGQDLPWKHWEERDGRTLHNMFPELRVTPYLKHDPVSDAAALAESLIAYDRHLCMLTV